MATKEKLDKLMTEVKKIKPYVSKTLGAVKAASLKVSQKAVPFIQKGFSKAKEKVGDQIKNYQNKKQAPKPESNKTAEAKDNQDKTPKA